MTIGTFGIIALILTSALAAKVASIAVVVVARKRCRAS
jgi:hypothetical protein